MSQASIPQDRWLRKQIADQRWSHTRYTQMSYPVWLDAPGGSARSAPQVQTTQMMEITITPQAWAEMVRLWDEHHAELANPAVQEAWSQYIMIRALCQPVHPKDLE